MSFGRPMPKQDKEYRPSSQSRRKTEVECSWRHIVTLVIRRHHSWLKKFWTPNRESYAGLGEGYTGFEWK